jgi:hypothetical protein
MDDLQKERKYKATSNNEWTVDMNLEFLLSQRPQKMLKWGEKVFGRIAS